jgi:hypothetical protein
VTCNVTEPMFNVSGSSVTVPYTPGIDTFLYGVNGHPETEAITSDVTVTGSLDGAPNTVLDRLQGQAGLRHHQPRRGHNPHRLLQRRRHSGLNDRQH